MNETTQEAIETVGRWELDDSREEPLDGCFSLAKEGKPEVLPPTRAQFDHYEELERAKRFGEEYGKVLEEKDRLVSLAVEPRWPEGGMTEGNTVCDSNALSSWAVGKEDDTTDLDGAVYLAYKEKPAPALTPFEIQTLGGIQIHPEREDEEAQVFRSNAAAGKEKPAAHEPTVVRKLDAKPVLAKPAVSTGSLTSPVAAGLKLLSRRKYLGDLSINLRAAEDDAFLNQ